MTTERLTDRELLEAAARAAGVDPRRIMDRGIAAIAVDGGQVVLHAWNPLIGNGDALRLAVALNLEIRQVHFAANVGVPNQFWRTEHHGNDPLAATRRAIVRAAAALGARG